MILLVFLFSFIFTTQASYFDDLDIAEFHELSYRLVTNFSRYDTIVDYLNVASRVCEHASLGTIGLSYEERDMPVIKFSTDPAANKPVILVDAGIHAREWLAPSTALFLIGQLCLPGNSELLRNVDWYIIPLLNPDGYEYTHTHDRFWRKTRSWSGSKCPGTDLNRNFDFHWMVSGSSSNECDSTYAGPMPFSEIEALNFKAFAEGIAPRIKLYVSLHSYGAQILYPYGFKAEKTENDNELYKLGKQVSDAISENGGNDYEVGMTAEVIYEAAGGSDDWMKGHLKIPLVYTIELPGEGFDVPPCRIIPVGQEIFDGFEVFLNYVEQNFI